MRYEIFYCEQCDTKFGIQGDGDKFQITHCANCGSNKSTYNTGEIITGED